MKIETRSIERPIIGVPISGFEVTSVTKFRGIPKPTSKISEQRKLWPKLRNFTNKNGVMID